MPGTVLITGASSGIGLERRESVRATVTTSFFVARRGTGEEVAAELRERVQVEVVVSDLSQLNACQALRPATEREIEVDYLPITRGSVSMDLLSRAMRTDSRK